jgi:hypothetical protein
MDLSHFDLNLLRSLDVLLKERNVTRAAERLFVTQQAASGALQRLRQDFDDELLTRVRCHRNRRVVCHTQRAAACPTRTGASALHRAFVSLDEQINSFCQKEKLAA